MPRLYIFLEEEKGVVYVWKVGATHKVFGFTKLNKNYPKGWDNGCNKMTYKLYARYASMPCRR